MDKTQENLCYLSGKFELLKDIRDLTITAMLLYTSKPTKEIVSEVHETETVDGASEMYLSMCANNRLLLYFLEEDSDGKLASFYAKRTEMIDGEVLDLEEDLPIVPAKMEETDHKYVTKNAIWLLDEVRTIH